jgi:hypothetical protein
VVTQRVGERRQQRLAVERAGSHQGQLAAADPCEIVDSGRSTPSMGAR